MKKILHIVRYEKFIADYITKINDLFDSKDHLFYVHGERGSSRIREIKGDNVIYSNTDDTMSVYKELKKLVSEHDRVILHSIIYPAPLLIAVSLLVSENRDKFFWNIWGADLYDHYRQRNDNFLSRAREVFRKRIISRIKAVGAIPGDYEFLKKAYGVSPKRYEGLYTYDLGDIPERKDDDAINVLIGNSANPYCRHFEAIDMLERYRDKDMRVYCILSYPKDDLQYIEKVTDYGKEKLGDRFIAVTDYMSYEDYMVLLGDIDIAIFNNDRQQANGNIVSLLYYGKKVFVNPLNAFLDYYKEKGALIYSTEELNDDLFKKEDPIKENTELIRKLFSDEEFRKNWDLIFEDERN